MGNKQFNLSYADDCAVLYVLSYEMQSNSKYVSHDLNNGKLQKKIICKKSKM